MTDLNQRIAHIERPARLRRLPTSAEGYPIPWFVATIDGRRDFRAFDGEKLNAAIRFKRCWLCGEPLGRHMTFVIGPMCAVNLTSAEPPCHHDCALYAARACPFLTQPRMRRNEKALPEDRSVAGLPIFRNPGVALLWTTKSYRLQRAGGGVVFRIGPPETTEWFCMGRAASRAEVQASLDSGLPALRKVAEERDGGDAPALLDKMVAEAMRLLPEEAAP